MARAYQTLVNEPQFGGAMTWEVSLDKDNNYQFAKTIGAVLGKKMTASNNINENKEETKEENNKE